MLEYLPRAAQQMVEAGEGLGLPEVVSLGYVLQHQARAVESVRTYLDLAYGLGKPLTLPEEVG